MGAERRTKEMYCRGFKKLWGTGTRFAAKLGLMEKINKEDNRGERERHTHIVVLSVIK